MQCGGENTSMGEMDGVTAPKQSKMIPAGRPAHIKKWICINLALAKQIAASKTPVSFHEPIFHTMGFLETFLPPNDSYAALLLFGMVFYGFDAGIMTVILADKQFNEYYNINANRSGLVATIP